MASAEDSVAGREPAKAKPPFRGRFKAWWEGYERVDRGLAGVEMVLSAQAGMSRKAPIHQPGVLQPFHLRELVSRIDVVLAGTW